MTSRELVRRNITFDHAPRIAIKFDVFGFNDCYDVWLKDCSGFDWSISSNDEWGCRWERTSMDNSCIVGCPLTDWEKLSDYSFPNPDDPGKYADFNRDLSGAGEKFVMFCGGLGLFERFHCLRGFENALADLYVDPERTHEMLDRILDYHVRQVKGVHDRGGGRVDAVAFSDDWGTELSSIISPEKFREFFKPRYAELFKHIHDLGMHTWLHSCGRINEVLDDLIDAGLDVVNSQQPRTVGIDEFGRRFAGRICFETIVDTQITYPHGTLDEIRAEARELVEKWGTPSGGFIASDYNDAGAIGTTLERRRAAFDVFREIADHGNSVAGAPRVQ